MSPDEDDGRKAEHIAPAIDRTLAEIIRKNVEKRISGNRTIIKRAKTQEEIVAATLGRSTVVPPAPLPLSSWSPAAVKQAEDRMHRRPTMPPHAIAVEKARQAAMIPVTLRIATELPFPAVSFKHNGAVFVSTDLRVWRATTQYDRLVARLTSNHTEPIPAAVLTSVFKSLTSPTVLPRNVTLIKPPNFTFVAPPPVVTPPKKEAP